MLDTGPVVAFSLPADEYHLAARAHFRTPALRLFTTATIVGEIYTFLRRRAGHHSARAVVRNLQASPVVSIDEVDDAFDAEIWRVIDEYAGVPLSYPDASLVVLGRRLRITTAFSFDSDLAAAGLRLVPESAGR